MKVEMELKWQKIVIRNHAFKNARNEEEAIDASDRVHNP